MSKLENQWIDIFRAGAFHQGTDKECQFTAQDVQQVVDNYDPAQYEVPAVIGHPEHDAPAYAWVSQVRRVGDVLQGKLKQVVPAFEQAVEDGRFKNRSVRLAKVAKGYALRHVGFLGAKIPEVKGLAPIQFGVDEDVIEIDFAALEPSKKEEQDMTATEQQTFNERMKTFFQGIFGDSAKPETKTFSEAEVKQIALESAAAAAAEAVKPFEARLAAQEVKFSERENALTTSEIQTRAEKALNQVKKSGRWIPAFDKMGVDKLFSELAGSETTIEFAEADGKTAKKAPLAILVEFMEALPKIVPVGEVYGGQSAATGAGQQPSTVGQVNSSRIAQADPNSIAFAEAIEKRRAEKGVSFEVAMTQIAREQPHLTRPGGASAGAV